jgi:hypothetical protein
MNSYAQENDKWTHADIFGCGSINFFIPDMKLPRLPDDGVNNRPPRDHRAPAAPPNLIVVYKRRYY